MDPGGGEMALDAKALREQAERDCDARWWVECIAGLDTARREDPSGDEAPEVKALRDKAVKALMKRTAAPPLRSVAEAMTRFLAPFDKIDTALDHDLPPRRLTMVREAITEARSPADLPFSRPGIGRPSSSDAR
jgi:hypothetical protein